MDIKLLNNLFSDLRYDDICFAYSGSFSDSITVKLIDLARFNIESRGENTGLKNKVSFLMGECYQNIVRHGISTQDTLNLQEKSNIFFLRIIEGNYYITSANPIDNEWITNIKSKLDRVNSLSPDELKELQRQVMMSGELSEKGGAGIGIILMARKTGQKLEYFFEKVDDKFSIFYLHVKLQNVEPKNPLILRSVSVEKMIKLHDYLVNEGILIMHKGDFSKETFLPVIKMIEGNLEDRFEKNFTRTKLYHVSVEILQNISLHGLKKNRVTSGIFTLGKVEDHFIIGASNYVDKQKAASLASLLQKLKYLSKSELDNLYRDKLRLVLDHNDEGVGMGLIDIFRDSKLIDYSIAEDGESSLFTIVIKI